MSHRSHEPIFWSLFGAGGMLAALIGAALVFVTGLGVSLGLGVPAGAMRYGNVLAFAQSWSGKIALFVVISLFLWHAAHRIAILLHDLGVPAGFRASVACYGLAFAGSVMAAWLVLAIG